MKRLIIALVITLGIVLAAPLPVRAEEFDPFGNACTGEAANSELCNDADSRDNPIAGKDGVLTKVVQILSFVVGVAAVIVLMYGGLKYITSNGDANSISTAKNTILYAIIGVVVFLFSQAIVIFVLNRL